jgi:CubicO group peptidase (beta-lactamase class C family)
MGIGKIGALRFLRELWHHAPPTLRSGCFPMVRFLVFLSAAALWAAPSIAAPPPPPAAKAAPKPPVAGPAQPVLPSDADVQRIADDRVVTYRDSVGLVIGLIDPSGRRIVARGPARIGNDDNVDGNTIFEIGSLTKIFTAALLAEMARKGEVALTDPIAKYLPPGVKLPDRNGRSITLLDLATHTSGLPKTVANVAATDLNDPDAAMNADQLIQSVGAYELTRDIGSAYEYSDVGYQLLALALTEQAKTDFETLLRSRILAPLRMVSTRLSPSTAEKENVSSGYDSHLEPVARVSLPSLSGATGLRSTANDLLTFLAANLGLDTTPLNLALAEMLKVRRPTQYAELNIALGWHVATLHGKEIVWLSGQTAGYRAFIGFTPANKAGVVVLSNASNTIDDIGVHLLDNDTPLRTLHREAPISASQFDNYLGRYVVNDNFSLLVTRDKGHLYLQGTGQPRAELFSAGDDVFFLRAVEAEATFVTDESGRANSVRLSQGGKTAVAVRVQ